MSDSKTIDVIITEVEIAKLNLKPDDVLVVKIKGEDFDHQESLNSLRQMLKSMINNKIMLFSMDKGHEIEFTVLEPEPVTATPEEKEST